MDTGRLSRRNTTRCISSLNLSPEYDINPERIARHINPSLVSDLPQDGRFVNVRAVESRD